MHALILKAIEHDNCLGSRGIFGNPYYESSDTEDNFKRSSPCSDF